MQGCPFCEETKQFLIKESIDFKEIDVDENTELFESVKQKTGFTYVPQLLIADLDNNGLHNGKFVSKFDTVEECVEQVRYVLIQN
jgi:glutaredoxin